MNISHVIVAMKPIEGNFVENALEFGVAGINVDDCRVSGKPRTTHKRGNVVGQCGDVRLVYGMDESGHESQGANGRFPANILHDGSDEVVESFPETTSGSMKPTMTSSLGYHGKGSGYVTSQEASAGSASRFFKELR